jgi:hypothetical protein
MRDNVLGLLLDRSLFKEVQGEMFSHPVWCIVCGAISIVTVDLLMKVDTK